MAHQTRSRSQAREIESSLGAHYYPTSQTKRSQEPGCRVTAVALLAALFVFQFTGHWPALVPKILSNRGKVTRSGGAVPGGSDRERCQQLMRDYNVQPGVSWGGLDMQLRREWSTRACDRALNGGSALVADASYGAAPAAAATTPDWLAEIQARLTGGAGPKLVTDYRAPVVKLVPPPPPALTVKVLTYNRPKALERLLQSLLQAQYAPDVVDLEIRIDGARTNDNKELDLIAQVEDVANKAEWPHGTKTIIKQRNNMGLVGQWLTCYDDSDKPFHETDGAVGHRGEVLILEDDMEVSIYYWRWLKAAWSKYRRRQDLAGISLQHQHTNGVSGGGDMTVVNGERPYLYKIPGSWGFSPHREVWSNFITWQAKRAKSGYVPDDIQFEGKDTITTKWWKDMTRSGRDPAMWTQWFMRYMEDNGLYCLYPNLPGHHAFAASWNEVGEHDPGNMKGRRSTPLQMEWTPECEVLPNSLWRLDWDTSRVTAEPPPLRPRKCDLSDAHVFFDGWIYKVQQHKLGGVSKMWLNIVPYMISAVRAAGGRFTNAMSKSDATFDGANNVYCPDLDCIKTQAGRDKSFISSYYRGTPDACFIHTIYDHIPERTGMDVSSRSEYWPRIDNLKYAAGFLSISKSTTDDLCELYKMCQPQFVATSDNRAAPLFQPAGAAEVAEWKAKYGIGKEYFLVVGARYPYKNYDIFWAGIETMPSSFKDRYCVVLVGEEEGPRDVDVITIPFLAEAELPVAYTGAAAFVYTSLYEGFGMPPVEAAACGARLLLGPFHRDRMGHVFGNLSLYASDSDGIRVALQRIADGRVARREELIERARLYGTDPRHGWNEVARDYLEYMIHGPFIRAPKGGDNCRPLAPHPDDCRFVTTDTGIQLAP